ncbi:MAG: hydrogenase maturation protease [Anaerolineaceae bacterium]|jgi:hydrogenase maturation protease
MKKSLILGVGNPDRQDDGVAWHVLIALAGRLSQKIPASPEEDFEETNPQLLFVLQLTPDLAEMLATYDEVCFVDAHTAEVQTELQKLELEPKYQRSPFTHHLTPETCLALSEMLYGAVPSSILVSVRGYSFNFGNQLSPQTSVLAEKAATMIFEWLSSNTRS